MANKKSKYPKKPKRIYIEDSLFIQLIKESRKIGCKSHPNVGTSVSEISRRIIKGYFKNKYKYISESETSIDWSEAI
jgi:hypothetical protein